MHFQRITLVHYHELGLKGHNRATFEKRLMRNLEVLLEDAPVHEITRISGRVLVVYDAAAGADAPAKAAQLIARVPGVARVSCGFACERNMDDICEAAHQALGEAEGFFPAPVVAHPTNPMAGKFHLRDRQVLPFGDAGIEALFTPGHSRDSVCYRLTDNSALFTGDVLFVGCIGFCRSRDMYRSLTRKILPLDDRLVVYSGHDYGPVPFRTLGEEKRENPFLNCPDLETFQSLLQHLE